MNNMKIRVKYNEIGEGKMRMIYSENEAKRDERREMGEKK